MLFSPVFAPVFASLILLPFGAEESLQESVGACEAHCTANGCSYWTYDPTAACSLTETIFVGFSKPRKSETKTSKTHNIKITTNLFERILAYFGFNAGAVFVRHIILLMFCFKRLT